MGISRSELFPGFNRCLAEWKSPLIRSFVPEPDHRHSAQRQQRALMLVPFAPLEYKGIRSASLRWWSFQNLRWSQVLTSVPNRISHPKTLFSIWQIIISSKWIWHSFRNEDLHLRGKTIRLSASCHSPWWMTSCRKPNTTSKDFRKQVPELSLRNDLWLSFREPSRFYRTQVR